MQPLHLSHVYDIYIRNSATRQYNQFVSVHSVCVISSILTTCPFYIQVHIPSPFHHLQQDTVIWRLRHQFFLLLCLSSTALGGLWLPSQLAFHVPVLTRLSSYVTSWNHPSLGLPLACCPYSRLQFVSSFDISSGRW
jgi:hypothetical protein